MRRAATAALLAVLAVPSRAVELKVPEVLKTITLSGDLRLRQENFKKTTAGQADRSRQRLRLRLATELGFPENVKVKLRFGSGTGEQTSTNQSLDNGSSQKQFWIDRAYVEWKPLERVRLQGGRQANPLWTTYTSDAVWDEDLNPEGFGQSLEAMMPGGARLFANALQMVVDEDAGTTADQWEFSGQAGVELPVGPARWTTAGAYHHWTNASNGAFGQVALGEGNRRIAAGPSAGALANDFGVAELTSEVLLPLGKTSLTPGVTVLKNFAARHLQRDGHRLGDAGFQAGARLGKAAAEKTWEAAYYYKWVEVDASPADFADADFGDGGTNRQGHIAWLAYAPRDWLQLKGKALFTRVIDDAEPPGRDHINRFQLDLALKF